MHETELDPERRRVLVAEGLAAALTEAARRDPRHGLAWATASRRFLTCRLG
jgi:hypothetical protein